MRISTGGEFKVSQLHLSKKYFQIKTFLIITLIEIEGYRDEDIYNSEYLI